MAALEKILETEGVGLNGSDSGNARDESISNRPIDLVHLSRQSLGDPGLEAEILRMFDQMILNHLSTIRKSADVEMTLINLHALKGAAAGVGANNIAILAKAAEMETKLAGKLSHECLADLRMAVEEVRHFIAELLED